MELGEYFKIRINSLIPNEKTTFTLYLRVAGNMVVYLHAGDYLSLEKIQALNQKDSGNYFYVSENERGLYQEYLRERLNSDELTSVEKAKILRESSIVLVEELFEKPDVYQALEEARPIIRTFMEYMDTEPEAIAQMISLSSHDFYTYNHSLDVSIYSLGLAQSLGFSGAELEEIGVGALFHDLGKRHVPLDILCKKGSLEEPEWKVMQRHPQFGLLILKDQPNISDGIKAACFEHHESFSGNGYPQKLAGDEIHPFARIIALTDTFDAMTTKRTYNVPMTPMDALNMIKEKLHSRYDPEMLKAMHSALFYMRAG
jgi:HD-GYP domain-containing protein (c-di-GMP phosphodiesterase class II)